MRFRRREKREPGLFFMLLMGLVFVGAGVCSGFFVGQTHRLECARVESNRVNCMVQRELLGMPVGSREIGHVEEAWVDVSRDSEDGDTYRVMLRGPAGDAPFKSFYSSSRNGNEATAGEINGFLADPSQPSLVIEQTERWAFLLAACFMSVGLLIMGWGVLRVVFRVLKVGRAL